MSARTQINRDPFARMTLMRQKLTTQCECAWCGQPARFNYYWESDCSRGPQGQLKPFCSVGCFRTYYDGGAA